tara:strand:- start:16314 stop:16634 length:321 start_codon:yes stop_codon:yes gene_type:complete
MSKIKKVQEITDLSVHTIFIKDEGMFQIEANIYSMVTEVPGSTNKYGHDIGELQLSFSINNKKVNYTGFKTLYEQLYGENTFNAYWSEKSDEFEAAYLKTTPYKSK